MVKKTKTVCPLIKDECLGHGCEWYLQIRGSDPQTGKPVDEFDCAVKWLPMLLIENAKQVRHTSCEVGALRNEATERYEIGLRAQLATLEHRAKELNDAPHIHTLSPGD